MGGNRSHWGGIVLFLTPVAVLYALFFLYPLGYVFTVSLVDWNGVTAMRFVGLENYLELLQRSVFRLSVRNNLIWALSLGLGQIGLAVLVALILARRPAGWRLLRTIYFLPNVISQVALAMMWLAIYNAEYGILNAALELVGWGAYARNWLGEIDSALPAIILQQLLYIGYFMIIILAATLSISETFYEAAEIDGANVWQQERHITLPIIRPIMITAVTLAMAFGLRHFEATFLMTNGGPANSTSVLGIMLYKTVSALNYGRANAVAVTLIVIGTLLIVTVRRLARDDAAAEERQ